MKNQTATTRHGLQLLVATVLTINLATPTAWAGRRGGVRSSNRNVNVNRNANVNVNRNVRYRNVNVNQNINVNRNINVTITTWM